MLFRFSQTAIKSHGTLPLAIFVCTYLSAACTWMITKFLYLAIL